MGKREIPNEVWQGSNSEQYIPFLSVGGGKCSLITTESIGSDILNKL